MERIFIPVIGLVFLLQTVGTWPAKFHSDELMSELEEDWNWIPHRIPDNPQHKLQLKTLVLDENPMNEPEEDRDMIHHGSLDIPQQDFLRRMSQPAKGSSPDRDITAQQGHHLPMVLPPEPMNEPEEDRDMIHHGM